MEVRDIFGGKLEKRKRLLVERGKLKKGERVICPKCKKSLEVGQVLEKGKVCPDCLYYFPLTARERIRLLVDPGSFREKFGKLRSQDPLDFPAYQDKLMEARERTGLEEAVVTGQAKIRGFDLAIGVMDGRFLMGSMGTVVGEKLAALTEYAGRKHLPLLIFTCSGGARMQEGMFSLLQMAKTAAAVERFQKGGGFFISYLTHPTTGGVSASFAFQGDIILAEPQALICFAGPRVIEQTIGEELPPGFQRAEFLLAHGMLDRVVERREAKDLLAALLKIHQKQRG